jgi:hypothetical protein
MTNAAKDLEATKSIGYADGYHGRPRNAPFTRHLEQAYNLAYNAGQRVAAAEKTDR